MPGMTAKGGAIGLACRLVSALLLALTVTSAFAHRQTGGGSGAGIRVPNLTHGQMAVIAEHKAEILALVDRQTDLDETGRRLRSFVDWQNFFCFRGLVPGSLKDEDSPFNECSHAYLAGTQALLLHVQKTHGEQPEVRALVDKIGLDMARNNASLVLCRFSSEDFNTADLIAPHWSEVASHPPSLATFGGLGLILAGGAWFGLRRRGAAISAPSSSG